MTFSYVHIPGAYLHVPCIQAGNHRGGFAQDQKKITIFIMFQHTPHLTQQPGSQPATYPGKYILLQDEWRFFPAVIPNSNGLG
jgi:hypothetical protein